MMLDFLNGYSKAVRLDDARFKAFFPKRTDKSDFLLFEGSAVCEFKEIKDFKVKKRVEYLAKKGLMPRNFKRDFYNTINKDLNKANQQIKETKDVLGKPGALGLVIIENLVPTELSVLALIDAVDRKMKNGLEAIDAALCVDFINTFVDETGSHIQPAQLVSRDTEESERLYYLVGNLLEDFCKSRSAPLHNDFNIFSADQRWEIDSAGSYKSYSATINPKDR